jgi:hypothetical protein
LRGGGGGKVEKMMSESRHKDFRNWEEMHISYGRDKKFLLGNFN